MAPFGGELTPGTLRHVIGEAHIYERHVEGLRGMLERVPRRSPRLVMGAITERDILENTIDGTAIKIDGYEHAGDLKLEFVV